MGSMMGGPQQMNQGGFKQQPPMNNFLINQQQQQMPKMQSAPQMGQNQNNLYGGLVNLNNLGSNNANAPFGGANQGGFGATGFSMGNTSQQQQKKDAFSGLMTGFK